MYEKMKLFPNTVRDYDARAIPFEQWKEEINDRFNKLQKETAKRVIKRFYKKVEVCDMELQTDPDDQREKIIKLKVELQEAIDQL